MPDTPTYARGTKVSVDQSYSEIRTLIQKRGGEHFAFVETPDANFIEFVLKNEMEIGLRIRVALPIPPLSDFERNKDGRNRRTPTAAKLAQETAIRERWRALLAIIKAKLIAIESGITTIEEQFGWSVVMPDNQTVGYHAAEPIRRAYETGQPQKLLPWSGQ